MPNFLSSDNDPLYRFHQWQANLRILEVTEIKSVPYVPLSHPFVEGSLIVDPYFRRQWLLNFSNIRAHCGIRSGLQKPG